MGRDLIPYNDFNELSNQILTGVSSSGGPVTNFIGDFISALFKPILDHEKLKKLETIIIVKGRQDAEVKKKAIEAIRQALNSGVLAPEAQIKAIDILDKIINSD